MRTASATSGLRRTVVLDADGLSKLARRDRVVRAMVEQEIRDSDSLLVVPIVVTPQSLTDTCREAVRRVLAAAHDVSEIDLDRAEHASTLMRDAELRDVVD